MYESPLAAVKNASCDSDLSPGLNHLTRNASVIVWPFTLEIGESAGNSTSSQKNASTDSVSTVAAMIDPRSVPSSNSDTPPLLPMTIVLAVPPRNATSNPRLNGEPIRKLAGSHAPEAPAARPSSIRIGLASTAVETNNAEPMAIPTAAWRAVLFMVFFRQGSELS